ncbi:MAG: hypothetical protein L6R41_004784 [Letrouitia leprolyta]|nr:MAG: hypothetical protein L6R41_004784 [Letrouitia leprolyta]
MKVPFRIRATISVVLAILLVVEASSRSREPITYLSLLENPEIRTPSNRVHAFSNFNLFFDLHQSQQRIKLTLEPNHDIIAQGAVVTFLDENGAVERRAPINRHEHRVYLGDSWVQDHDGSWISAGWARITVKRDGPDPLFEGAFTLGRDHHHVLLRSNYLRTKHDLDPDLERGGDEYMIVYRDSDIFRRGSNHYGELKRSVDTDYSCSSDLLTFNTNPAHPVFAPTSKQEVVGLWGSTSVSSLFGKRQIDTSGIPSGGNSGVVNLKAAIGHRDGCPTTRRVALVGVATDCEYTSSFETDQEITPHVIQQFQTASSLYEKTFSITLGLANLTINKRDCPANASQDAPWNTGCSSSVTITDRLNMFSQWRGERNDSNAYWTLLTNCATGSEVGLSWLGQLCVTDVTKATGEVVSGANVVAKTGNEWQVIAHESGHTFGAVHDCDSSACSNQNSVYAQQCCPLSDSTCDAGERFIMNPSTGQGISEFSQCTLGNVCSAIGRNGVKTTCLTDNKNVPSVSGHQCGNGIVEDDEECDCGGTAGCGDNSCCEPTTCRFKTGASMQQNFLDGTPCGGGGRCSNGQCKGSSTAKEIGDWIDHNRPVVIGVSCGVGGLVLLAILSCCIRRCRRPKHVRARSPPMQQGWAGGPMPQGNGWNTSRGSGAPNGYWNGPPPPNWQHGPPPPPIPPQYMQPSVRYA